MPGALGSLEGTLGCGDWVCGGLGSCGGVPPGLRVGRSPSGGRPPGCPSLVSLSKFGRSPRGAAPKAWQDFPYLIHRWDLSHHAPYHHFHAFSGCPQSSVGLSSGFQHPPPSYRPARRPSRCRSHTPYLYVLWAGPDHNPLIEFVLAPLYHSPGSPAPPAAPLLPVLLFPCASPASAFPPRPLTRFSPLLRSGPQPGPLLHSPWGLSPESVSIHVNRFVSGEVVPVLGPLLRVSPRSPRHPTHLFVLSLPARRCDGPSPCRSIPSYPSPSLPSLVPPF